MKKKVEMYFLKWLVTSRLPCILIGTDTPKQHDMFPIGVVSD